MQRDQLSELPSAWLTLTSGYLFSSIVLNEGIKWELIIQIRSTNVPDVAGITRMLVIYGVMKQRVRI